MTEPKSKSALIVSSFNDAGAGESFVAGETANITKGQFQNYEAAGLVRSPNAEAKPASRRRAATRKPSARASAPSKSAPPAELESDIGDEPTV